MSCEHGTLEVDYSRPDPDEEDLTQPSSVGLDEVDQRGVETNAVKGPKHEGSVANDSTIGVAGVDHENGSGDGAQEEYVSGEQLGSEGCVHHFLELEGCGRHLRLFQVELSL